MEITNDNEGSLKTTKRDFLCLHMGRQNHQLTLQCYLDSHTRRNIHPVSDMFAGDFKIENDFLIRERPI